MPHIAEHLAALTGVRDRDVLDAGLVGVLQELLDADSVAVHRCVGEKGRQRWLTRARLRRGEVAAAAESLWSEFDALPPLERFADRHACLKRQRPVACGGETATTYFPLETETDTIGVVEAATATPLSTESLRLVASILRVYRNFERLLDYSERDSLTGLLNRKTFDENFLRLAMAEPAPADAPGAAARRRPAGGAWLAMIDIDHFKTVNDRFGHLIGDEVLLLLARLMNATFRFHDQLYRFGGEEFVVLMRCPDVADAVAAVERLRQNVERYAFPQVGRITVSVGFTALRPDDSPSSAFERADKAVYHVKQNGRNRIADHAELVAAGALDDAERDGDIEIF